MGDAPNGNGLVTLAVLATKLDSIDKRLDRIEAGQVGVTSWCTTSQERWRTHESHHADLESELRSKRVVGDVAGYIWAGLAAAIASLVKTP